LDDKFIAPTKLKFFLIAVISLATPLITGSPSHFPFGAMAFAIPAPIAYGGAALWVFVVINAVNFFDGSNGIMGASMAIASAGLSLYAMIIGVTDVALIAACLSAAIIGFLPYNYRKRAQIFCGDTGALFIGFVFAAAVLRLNAHDSGNLSLFAGPLLILPLLMDVLLTILRRIRDKDALLTPHSRHLYQTMIGAGRSHMRVAGHYVRGAIIASLAAIIGGATGLIASMFYFLIWAVLVALIYRAAIKYYGARDQRGR
ncbi:MAG: MraY family glycosyltransferase, partial [Robiginitomaculum sp.]